MNESDLRFKLENSLSFLKPLKKILHRFLPDLTLNQLHFRHVVLRRNITYANP
jgi:hypothetical protein